MDRIRSVFGAEVAKNLVPVHLQESGKFFFDGFVSSLSYGHQQSLGKRFDFVLFVNGRLVDSPRMKKAVGQIYEVFLMKRVFPFFFGELVVPGESVDVNIHPTKGRVLVEREDEIIAAVVQCVENSLKGSEYEKSFFVPLVKSSRESFNPFSTCLSAGNTNGVISSQSTPPSRMVRTDHREKRLDRFVSPVSESKCNPVERSQDIYCGDTPTKKQKEDAVDSLESVFNLREQLKANIDEKFVGYFSDCVLVGFVDNENCLFQKGTTLNVVKFRVLLREFFATLFFNQFGVFEYFLKVDKTCSEINEIDQSEDSQKNICVVKSEDSQNNIWNIGDQDNQNSIRIVKSQDSLLKCSEKIENFTNCETNLFEDSQESDSVAEMLHDYFGIRRTNSYIRIPTVVENIQLTGVTFKTLEMLYQSILNSIDWDDEEKSLSRVVGCLAEFYSEAISKDCISQVVFDRIKKHSFSKQLHSNQEVNQKLTDLHDLYRIFERC